MDQSVDSVVTINPIKTQQNNYALIISKVELNEITLALKQLNRQRRRSRMSAQSHKKTEVTRPKYQPKVYFEIGEIVVNQ